MEMKKFTRLSLLLALSIVLNIIESVVPLFNGYIPGLKLGLATKVGSDMIYPDIDEQNWYEPFNIQYDHVYEGTIYMPIHMNKNSSILN